MMIIQAKALLSHIRNSLKPLRLLPRSTAISTRQLATGQASPKEGLEWTDYLKWQEDRSRALRNLMGNSQQRFQKIGDREDRSDIPIEAVIAHTTGKFFTVHRGCEVMKGPLDLVIYSQLFWYVKPVTIFEIGAYTGGLAVWMADTLKAMGISCDIYSMDINLSLLDDRVKEIKPPNIRFVQGNSCRIEETFSADFLHGKPHPWVIVEDAHKNVHGVLEHFHQFTKPGDYIIADDTSPQSSKTLGISDNVYKGWGPIKLNALKEFLTEYRQYYCVDKFFTDFFGYNGTSNWHGYIRRI